MAEQINIRELILEALLETDRNGAFSHIVIRNVLEKYQFLPKNERSFFTRVVEGTIEYQLQLDYILNQFSKVKVRKMKPAIRCILRSAVYQMKYMDAVPDSAACNEAVKLAERKGFRNLKGFVNGVLRTISRNMENITWPDEKKDRMLAWSVRYSMPQWLIEQWIQDYGKEQTKAMLEAWLQEHPTTIRVDTNRISAEKLAKRLKEQGICVKQDEELSECLYLSGYDSMGRLEEFQQGLFYIQDKSSMLVAKMAAPKEGDFCIDVCAAPGGKSIHLAQLLHGTGQVEARDLTEHKTNLIKENKERCEVENLSVKQWDATVVDESAIEKADIVIADLPCSGLGVIGKKVDIKYRMTRQEEEELAELQRKILSIVQQYVKPNGTLVYSTCTIDRLENEENVAWFTQKFPQFALQEMRQILPGADGNDGFFLAKFQKESKYECASTPGVDAAFSQKI